MKVLFLCQYYYPEEQNAFVHECARSLRARHHDVTVLTAFPHYGRGEIYDGYTGKIFQREVIDGVPIVRSWVYATPKKSLVPRMLNFLSFCMSALITGLFGRVPAEIL